MAAKAAGLLMFALILGGGAAKAQPASVESQIRDWYLAAGYEPWRAEAMVDNARIESRFTPCVVAKSGSRYTFQWVGIRTARLHAAYGAGCPSLNNQLTFANDELYHESSYFCFWHARDRHSALVALRRGFGHGHC